MELLTAAQMRAIERAAIDSGAVTGLELMERAGRGVVEAIWEEWPELKAISGRAVVLCGPGNNGGDGFVVARLLKEWGWEVEVFLYGDAEKLPPDARVNYERWGELGEVGDLSNETDFSVSQPHIVVDAIFGAGLDRPITTLGGVLYDLESQAHYNFAANFGQSGSYGVVAIDAPSGLCLDSGRAIGSGRLDVCAAHSAAAHATVTFHSLKTGHLTGDGPEKCGSLLSKEMGVKSIGRRRDEGATLVTAPPLMGKQWFGHKYSFGHALCVSGGVGKGGAARLAARGALRIGAGLVTVGCPPSALVENGAALEAIMVRRVEEGAALAAMLEEDARITALCLGPGMGTGAREAGLVSAALSRSANKEIDLESAALSEMERYLENPYSGVGTVLDADALTLLSRDQALIQMLHDRCVLTPHAGEFARLFPDIAKKLTEPPTNGPAYSKVDATREAAKRAGCVVLYKGPDTVIADPHGRCSINAAVYDRAAPWLATAGSGDVLAGFITGLMARGFGPMQAAETGAWLHVECARSFGPGLIAEDLPEELPRVFRDLGL